MAILILGAALVAVAYLDALATTVVVREGAGPVTRWLTKVAWKAALRLRRSGGGSRVLAAGGGALLVGTVFTWVALLWTGWTLIFLTGDIGVVESSTREPAGWVDVAYFAGYTVFTLGVGDFVATGPGWRVAAAVASFSGLFLITLAITYLISVVSAVVSRRALAVRIGGLGATGTEIATRGWRGGEFSTTYLQQLATLSGEVAVTAEQHLAYPILHTFHSPHVGTCAPLALAELDDAVQMLLVGVAPEARPDPSPVLALRHSLGRYITTATASAPSPHQQEPPMLSLGGMRAAGIPAVDDQTFVDALDIGRRMAMARLVSSAGWSWPPPAGDDGR